MIKFVLLWSESKITFNIVFMPKANTKKQINYQVNKKNEKYNKNYSKLSQINMWYDNKRTGRRNKKKYLQIIAFCTICIQLNDPTPETFSSNRSVDAPVGEKAI